MKKDKKKDPVGDSALEVGRETTGEQEEKPDLDDEKPKKVTGGQR